MPTIKLESRITKQWGDIGFQGEDPKTDFRGMGMLGLINLLWVLMRDHLSIKQFDADIFAEFSYHHHQKKLENRLMINITLWRFSKEEGRNAMLVTMNVKWLLAPEELASCWSTGIDAHSSIHQRLQPPTFSIHSMHRKPLIEREQPEVVFGWAQTPNWIRICQWLILVNACMRVCFILPPYRLYCNVQSDKLEKQQSTEWACDFYSGIKHSGLFKAEPGSDVVLPLIG